MKKLVIIGGIPRSGTNLARRIIGSHSQIAIPPGEFQLFNRLSNGYTVQKALSHERLQKWNIDLSRFYGLNPRDAYIETLKAYADSIDKPIPGEKTPFNEFWYDDITAAGNAYDLKFIHLVRNPVDVAASYKHMRSMKSDRNYSLKDISAHLRNWHRSVSLGLARQWNDPVHYRLLRYEDMASRPEETTADLCEFIGIRFEKDRMLSLSNYADAKVNSSFKSPRGDNHSKPAVINAPSSRKDYLSRSEIQLICETCGELAAALGYDDPDFFVSKPDSERNSVLRRVLRRGWAYLPNVRIPGSNRSSPFSGSP